MSDNQARGRILQGVVVSSKKRQQTITVEIERRVKHPLYQKITTKTAKLHVHDAEERCKDGDKVLIQETRPISKTKSWVLLNILEQAS